MSEKEAGKAAVAGIAVDCGRRALLRGMLAAGGTLALAGCGIGARPGPGTGGAERLTGGRVTVRWLGGGVVEIATPDYKQIAYGDAWIWNNAGWTRFNISKAPEYASRDAFVNYVVGKRPEAVFVLLTHDHGDHIGDYFEMLKGLADAGVPVLTAGQSDLMRKGLVEDFKKAGLDPAKIVANNGAGMNFGGIARHGAMTARLVPAVHSTLAAYPAAGFMLDIGGVRVYISGDTDLFGEMRTLGARYQPNLGIVCVGNGPFTMGPEEAARACQWLGVSHAIPVHYAHNPFVRGVDAGEAFQRALAQIAPGVQVSVMKPGETRIVAT
ncbi:MAG: MBL fold metallo-hydrolase [Burkholderiales bacterium]|nr:MBL fold metallo-hydrolase [Burkholderiales bacterium]